MTLETDKRINESLSHCHPASHSPSEEITWQDINPLVPLGFSVPMSEGVWMIRWLKRMKFTPLSLTEYVLHKTIWFPSWQYYHSSRNTLLVCFIYFQVHLLRLREKFLYFKLKFHFFPYWKNSEVPETRIDRIFRLNTLNYTSIKINGS